jgi:DNA-directed RNA polymerase II subunit RPB2
MSRDQYSLLKDFLARRVVDVVDVPHHKLRNYNMYKVFLNGDWVGMTEEPIKLIDEMDKKKMDGSFDQKNVAIVTDHNECEIKIYCDSGRLYRPTIKVKDNVIQLKSHHVNQISLNKAHKLKKITDWEEFLMKNPGVIEYVDSETQPYLLIADKSRVVEEMRQKMTKSVDLVKNVKSRHVDNRYDDMFYLKYTNCEIHPALLLGEISTNVPFSCRNQGPRNIFFYAQSNLCPVGC